MKRGELGLAVVLSTSGPGLLSSYHGNSGGVLGDAMVGASGSVGGEERGNMESDSNPHSDPCLALSGFEL